MHGLNYMCNVVMGMTSQLTQHILGLTTTDDKKSENELKEYDEDTLIRNEIHDKSGHAISAENKKEFVDYIFKEPVTLSSNEVYNMVIPLEFVSNQMVKCSFHELLFSKLNNWKIFKTFRWMEYRNLLGEKMEISSLRIQELLSKLGLEEQYICDSVVLHAFPHVALILS